MDKGFLNEDHPYQEEEFDVDVKVEVTTKNDTEGLVFTPFVSDTSQIRALNWKTYMFQDATRNFFMISPMEEKLAKIPQEFYHVLDSLKSLIAQQDVYGGRYLMENKITTLLQYADSKKQLSINREITSIRNVYKQEVNKINDEKSISTFLHELSRDYLEKITNEFDFNEKYKYTYSWSTQTLKNALEKVEGYIYREIKEAYGEADQYKRSYSYRDSSSIKELTNFLNLNKNGAPLEPELISTENIIIQENKANGKENFVKEEIKSNGIEGKRGCTKANPSAKKGKSKIEEKKLKEINEERLRKYTYACTKFKNDLENNLTGFIKDIFVRQIRKGIQPHKREKEQQKEDLLNRTMDQIKKLFPLSSKKYISHVKECQFLDYKDKSGNPERVSFFLNEGQAEFDTKVPVKIAFAAPVSANKNVTSILMLEEINQV